MLTIRPKEIFNRAHPAPLLLDWPKGNPGCSILETCLLIAAARIVNARRYFEFGTYLGRTSLNLMMNASPGSSLITLDLPAPIERPGNVVETDCMNAHFAAGPMAFEGTIYEQRIKRVTADSRTWKYQGPKDVDFVFIDGGHDVETLEADTDNAFRMLKPGGVIAWHDYGHPGFQPLTDWLDSRKFFSPEVRLVVHAAETLLVFYFDGIRGILRERRNKRWYAPFVRT